MDVEVLRAVIESAIKDATKFNWLAYAIVIIIAALTSFLGSYLRKKSENIATKEDIGKITNEVEKIKQEYSERLQNLAHQNQMILEQGNRQHQLRMAALDKRLEAHQKAYALCHKMIHSVYDREILIAPIVYECQDWWVENSLYLTAEAREGVFDACQRVLFHREMLINGRDQREVFVEENWKAINHTLKILVKGVELPPIAADKLSIPTDSDDS
jgi:hypothetical protein